jgi:hypothetical protein
MKPNVILLLNLILMISCNYENVLSESSKELAKVVDGANLLAICKDGQEILKPLGYGEFFVEEHRQISAQKMCKNGLEDLKVIYKNAHIKIKAQHGIVRIIYDWRSAGNQAREFEGANRKFLMNKMKIEAIHVTDPKPAEPPLD